MSVHGTQATGARANGMAENPLELEIQEINDKRSGYLDFNMKLAED